MIQTSQATYSKLSEKDTDERSVCSTLLLRCFDTSYRSTINACQKGWLRRGAVFRLLPMRYKAKVTFRHMNNK